MLRPHAERTLAAAEEAVESIKEVRTLKGGTATFGTFGSAHHYLLGGLVQDFRRRYPDVRVRVVGQNSAEVADAVRDGVLEAGLIALPIDDRGLEVRPSIREENHYVSASPQRAGQAEDDRGARRGAADPLRRALGRRRPDAPPARRARPARRRADRAADRGRVHDRGAGPRRAPAGRHDRGAERARDARLLAHAVERLARPAAVRHVRVRHPPQRASLARDPRVPGAGRAARWRPWAAGPSRVRWRHVPRPRDRRRRGVPADDLLAPGGRAADDGRERGARDAALGPDGARDDRPARARRLHHARRRQGARVHRQRARARRGRRAPPPADRALPDRRARDPLGRGPRGGRAARARDVAGAGVAHAGRDRRRQDLPARASDHVGERIVGVPLADVEVGAKRARAALRERGRGPAALPQGRGHRARHGGHRGRARRGARRRRGRRAALRADASRWRRRSRSWPTRRRRRAPRCPSSSCSPRTATAVSPALRRARRGTARRRRRR